MSKLLLICISKQLDAVLYDNFHYDTSMHNYEIISFCLSLSPSFCCCSFALWYISMDRSIWIMCIYLFFLFQAEVPPCKKNVHSFNECSSLKKPERTKCRWSAEESFYQDYNFIIQAVFLFLFHLIC